MEATLRVPGPEPSFSSPETVQTLAAALNRRLLSRKRWWLLMAGRRESRCEGDAEAVSTVLPGGDNSGSEVMWMPEYALQTAPGGSPNSGTSTNKKDSLSSLTQMQH